MVSAFFLLCALTLSIGIVRTTGATRLIWFFTGIIFFSGKNHSDGITFIDTYSPIPYLRVVVC